MSLETEEICIEFHYWDQEICPIYISASPYIRVHYIRGLVYCCYWRFQCWCWFYRRYCCSYCYRLDCEFRYYCCYCCSCCCTGRWRRTGRNNSTRRIVASNALSKYLSNVPCITSDMYNWLYSSVKSKPWNISIHKDIGRSAPSPNIYTRLLEIHIFRKEHLK